MTPDEMFRQYRLLSPDAADYTHCLFSEAAEDILQGSFNAADIPYEVFACYGEELPSKGDIEAVVSPSGNSLALIKVNEVRMIGEESLKGRRFFNEFASCDMVWIEITFSVVFS